MSDVSKLLERVRSEIAASKEKLKHEQQVQLEQRQRRQERMEKLEEVFSELREVWRPRLEAFAKELGNQVDVKPIVKPGSRQVAMSFKSPLASVTLRFSATPDPEVDNLVLAYDLEILPILMKFEKHSEISFPIDQVDSGVLADWLDDRLVAFVKTYLQLHENPFYLKDHMAHDPVADVKFPTFAAVAKRERGGKTYYFISEETAAEFDRS